MESVNTPLNNTSFNSTENNSLINQSKQHHKKRSVFQRFIISVKALNWLFISCVVLPTLISIAYFSYIASDVYISESRFSVRSPERQTSSPFGSLLKGSGFSSSQDDSYTVQDYMLSRDALKSLDDKLDIRNAFSSETIDVFSRFSGLFWWDNSFEDLYLYYKKKVEIDLDATSSITVLTVKSFSAANSYAMNEQLLQISEALVNKLNEVGRADLINFSNEEVKSAEKKAKSAALALSVFRNEKGVIDPEKQTAMELEQIVKMQDELIATQALLTQLLTFAKENPQIPSLQLKIKNLKQDIVTETIQVAGGDHSLANKAAQYQRLALERDFADKLLASAMVSLDQARNEAQRKQLYLERIVQPSMPDKSMEPRRIRGVLSTFLLGFILWGVLAMLFAGVREHQD